MKTVLLATTGMSPAVLTETVWALAREKPAVVPDEVYVVTTVSGAAKLKEQLFGADAVWETLRKNILGKKAGCDNRLVFDPADIVVARKKLGGKKIALDALADVADHTAFADTLCSKLWEFTSQPGTRVIASLAGGYKTMSALNKLKRSFTFSNAAFSDKKNSNAVNFYKNSVERFSWSENI